jgi:short-subunit dehydrogenase
MNQIPQILYGNTGKKTWCVIGSSRGIGLEFVRQAIARRDRVFATVRNVVAASASDLWAQAGADHGRCQMLICDILSEESINVHDLFIYQPHSSHSIPASFFFLVHLLNQFFVMAT